MTTETHEVDTTQYTEDNKEQADLLAHYPYLEQKDNKTSSHALGARNIKKELAWEFPGHKFSVRSDSYSGGNSIHIGWIDGPTGAEVEGIINKYEEGHFDGMIDLYEYNQSVFPAIFGGAKFVHSQRKVSSKHVQAVIDEFGWHEITLNEHGEMVGNSHERRFRIMREVDSRSYYVRPEPQPGKEPVPNGNITITENEEKNGVEIRFPEIPPVEIRDNLKANGFRWSKFSKCWYTKRTPETLAFAYTMADYRINTEGK